MLGGQLIHQSTRPFQQLTFEALPTRGAVETFDGRPGRRIHRLQRRFPFWQQATNSVLPSFYARLKG